MSSSIFTDGACKANGTRGAVAGWAWGFWNGPARGEPVAARAQRLEESPATNQRAELMALYDAMRWWSEIGGGSDIVFYTDSQYAMNCASKWGPTWRSKGWKRGSTEGGPLQNLDIIQPLVELWLLGRWAIRHVRGHQVGSGHEVWGNNWVDRAAVEGAGGIRLEYGLTSVVARVAAAATEKSLFPFEEEKPVSSVIEHVVSEIPKKVATRQTDIRNWFSSV
jgi:ribonuclease HI